REASWPFRHLRRCRLRSRRILSSPRTNSLLICGALAPRRTWLWKVCVFGIVGMRAAGHRGPHRWQTRIAKTFQPNFRGVVADHDVVPKQLKKLAALFRGGLEFCFVGEFL